MASALTSSTFLHSYRSISATLQSTRATPSTYLYLLSNPLPANIDYLKVIIVSHDQGSCDDPSQGSWTWFEASVLRPQSEDERQHLVIQSGVLNHPEDFGDQLRQQGWDFVPLAEDHEHPENEAPAAVSFRIATNTASAEWQIHKLIWLREAC